ncbi:DUF2017 domain-containing protein [Corynebacterium gerontici]|uniref:Uncharacterized protein n=1 Tax=Corynebacterium gerontici TaxID=2079234 RepID=A0A3G6J1V0_9CORY|nr:DUF2017 domain-containing protein [Corynebacterium gerontici]AZA11997.1 hypothetical protein CGERO_08530 [Corynebacterium gerontici]
MQPWKKKKALLRGTRYETVLEPIEREVLGDLAATVSEALIGRAQSAPKDELAELTGMAQGHTDAPEDPSLARLLPDFEREGDEEYEGDNSLLRSLHEQDITRAKLENLRAIGDVLGPDGSVMVSISEADAHKWLAGLNDLRLYLFSAEPENPDADRDRLNLVEWLAYNQESLLSAMMGPLEQ